MRLIPEYEPVCELYLSFVHDFFNTRFHYGQALCEIIAAASKFVDVKLMVSLWDMEHWIVEERKNPLCQSALHSISPDSPDRAILMEYVPFFAEDDLGQPVGLVFRNPHLEEPEKLKQFSQRMVSSLGIPCVDMGFDFSSAHVAVNENLVLLSNYWFQGEEGSARLEYFQTHFPGQDFHVVPSLAGDITHDLDMFLWPIKPGVWIASEYPAGSPQAESMAPALQILNDYGHIIHRVPGLEPIIYDDINTMPNYANGIILNQAALVPAYQQEEDGIVQGILKGYGFQVFPIDCRQVILTNSGVHCISKTVPTRVIQEEN
jgi:hypothetical protein